MAIENFAEFNPDIHETAFVAASADVIGRVTLGENSSVFYNATLRGDINEIVIGANSNIQDNVVVHLADNYGCYVGEFVTVGHSAILHACTVKDEVLVGMGAVLLNGVRVGTGSIIAAGAVLTEGTQVPAGSLVVGIPGRVVRALDAEQRGKILENAARYVELAQRHREGEVVRVRSE